MRAAVFKKIHIAPSSHAKKKRSKRGLSQPQNFRTMSGVTIDKRTDHLITRTHNYTAVPEKTLQLAESKVQELALAQGKEGHDTRTWIG
jgi:hypothetical protein